MRRPVALSVFPKVACGVAALCLLWFLPGLHAATTLDDVLAKIDEASKGFRAIECNLEQSKVTVLVNVTDVSSGKLYYMRTGKSEPRLRVEILKPAQQTLLIDKGKVQLFTPKINQVQEASLGGHANVVEQFMALGFGQSSQDLKKNYRISLAGEEMMDGKKTAMLDLVPPTPLAGIKAIRMWMDEQKGISVQVKITETGGDYGIYKYSNIKMNPGLPDSIFELKLPKGVKVNKL
jgi:outer membrane lipoprotein-sorting protein